MDNSFYETTRIKGTTARSTWALWALRVSLLAPLHVDPRSLMPGKVMFGVACQRKESGKHGFSSYWSFVHVFFNPGESVFLGGILMVNFKWLGDEVIWLREGFPARVLYCILQPILQWLKMMNHPILQIMCCPNIGCLHAASPICFWRCSIPTVAGPGTTGALVSSTCLDHHFFECWWLIFSWLI